MATVLMTFYCYVDGVQEKEVASGSVEYSPEVTAKNIKYIYIYMI